MSGINDSFLDEQDLGCGCQVTVVVRDDSTDLWCVGHDTWHQAEHHDFQGVAQACGFCGNENSWH